MEMKNQTTWKCRKCNIIFTNEKVMWKHLMETTHYDNGYCGTEPHTVYFHVIVDEDGDNVMYGKETFN